MQTLTCSIALLHRRVETPLCCMRAWLFAVIGRRLSHSRCLLSFYLPPSLPPSFSLSLPRPPSLLCSLLQAITHTCTQIGTDIYAPRCQAHRVFDASADNASVFSDHERSKIVALSINCRRPAASCTSFRNSRIITRISLLMPWMWSSLGGLQPASSTSESSWTQVTN